MKITVLVDNISYHELPVEHGLSLHMQLDDERSFLFDTGQSDLFAHNAARMNIAIEELQFAVLSHGHYDHGGGLTHLHAIAPSLPIYLHREALRPHYSIRPDGIRYIGLPTSLPEVMGSVCHSCSGVMEIAEGLTLFDAVTGDICMPPGNVKLFEDTKGTYDSFPDEQNLLIEEGDNMVLIAGCAHRGIVNIIKRAEEICNKNITHVIGGFHLQKMELSPEQEDAFIEQLAHELMSSNATFYTMHCTGIGAYDKLKTVMGSRLHYASCGEVIEIAPFSSMRQDSV